MAAFLGELLVFDLQRRSASFDIAAHRVRNIEQSAVTGVGIGNQRSMGDSADLTDTPDHIGISRKPRIRQAQM